MSSVHLIFLLSTTFLLSFDTFDSAYGIGENNCGFEVERKHRGDIVLCEGGLSAKAGKEVSDIAGQYTVTLDGKVYDTVRLMDIEESNNSRMVAEYYLDKHGRTILWRRFNRDDWAFDRYQKTWTEIFLMTAVVSIPAPMVSSSTVFCDAYSI